MSATLLKPLFVNDMFNRTGKHMRVKFFKTVASEGVSYDLYIKDSKNPENNYAHTEEDKFYLRVLVNGWLIPLRMTHSYLRELAVRKHLVAKMYGDEEKRKEVFYSFREGHSQHETDQLITAQIRKEEALEIELGKNGVYLAEYIRDMLQTHIQSYNDCKANPGGYPDFIGAALLDDLENCVRLSELRKQASETQRQANEEIVRKAKEAAAAELEAKVSEAKEALLNGGTLDSAGILLTLADRYHVPVAIRTRGWILNSFISCKINGSSISVQYWKKKGGKCSGKIYDVIWDIQAVVKQETNPPEEECP